MSEVAAKAVASKRVCKVTDLEKSHPRICANDWRTPLVLRLIDTETYQDGSCEVSVNYRWSSDSRVESVVVGWIDLKDEFEKRLRSYQAAVLTEHATLGLACVLVAEFPKLQITEVTRRGERADYWLGDREYLLEVSGQQSGNLDTLRDSKRDQLLENPFKLPGFVCVAVYDGKSSYLWFYEAAP